MMTRAISNSWRVPANLLAIAASVLLAAGQQAQAQVFPGKEWRVESPEAHGLDPAKLKQAEELFRAQEQRYGFLVVKDGVIVHETYFQGDKDTRHVAASATKSFGSALVGIAVTQGYLRVTDKVSDWVPVHHPEIAADATIENVLSMTSAREPAGSRFQYTSGNPLNTLPNVLWVATGVPPYKFFERELAKPLGLSIDWPHTENGWMQIGTQGVNGLGVMRTTHRDMARLGWLWLNEGKWKGKQLISKDYIRASITPPFPAANSGYGYLWWLQRDEGMRDDEPSKIYRAIGSGNQLIIVMPEHNMVVTTMGSSRGNSSELIGKLQDAINLFLE